MTSVLNFPGQGAALDQGIGDNRDKRPLRFKDIRGAKFQPIDSPFRDPSSAYSAGWRERGPRQICIIIPVLAGTSFDRMANMAEQDHRGIFFIFISSEISASDYKRLVRRGGADWVSIQGAPQEILDIISRTSRRTVRDETIDLQSWHCRAECKRPMAALDGRGALPGCHAAPVDRTRH